MDEPLEQDRQLTRKERREQRRMEKDARRAETEGREKKNRLLLWSAVGVVLIAVVFAMVKLAQAPSNGGVTTLPANILESVQDDEWIRDSRTASTTLIEYGDFECPACASYHPVLKQIHEEYGDRIRFVFRHFPLPVHRNSRIAARAAEAAGAQGKFWEMHDALFETQAEWTGKSNAQSLFSDYARALGLDMERFERDMRSTEIGRKIDDAYKSGLRYGVDATPSFFINNTRHILSSSADLKKALDAALANGQ